MTSIGAFDKVECVLNPFHFWVVHKNELLSSYRHHEMARLGSEEEGRERKLWQVT